MNNIFKLQKSETLILKVDDLSGRAEITLVNKDKQSGNYDIDFRSSKLSRSIYFIVFK
jgi:hypothetical protein